MLLCRNTWLRACLRSGTLLRKVIIDLRLCQTVILGVILYTCSYGYAGPKHLPTQSPVQFILMGDTGTGESDQWLVAKAIDQVCALRGCQFAIAAGDNIYMYGPRSVTDKQFVEKFEKPYQKLDFPFFMALGNHDQSGDLLPGSALYPEQGNIEVLYTKYSSKWVMPSRFYSFAAPFASAMDYTTRPTQPIIEFFVIDTNYLAPEFITVEDWRPWYRPGHAYDRAQRKWLRKRLSSSVATWKAVVGHHPYRNNGRMSNAGEYYGAFLGGLPTGEELKKFYEAEVCGKVDFLMTGHDHSLQWLVPFVEGCGDRTEFLISGTAAECYEPSDSVLENKSNKAYFEAYGTLGFFWIEATQKKMNVVAYLVAPDGKISQAYERVVRK